MCENVDVDGRHWREEAQTVLWGGECCIWYRVGVKQKSLMLPKLRSILPGKSPVNSPSRWSQYSGYLGLRMLFCPDIQYLKLNKNGQMPHNVWSDFLWAPSPWSDPYLITLENLIFYCFKFFWCSHQKVVLIFTSVYVLRLRPIFGSIQHKSWYDTLLFFFEAPLIWFLSQNDSVMSVQSLEKFWFELVLV